MTETEIGQVTHYFDKLGVATINLIAGIKVGDKIRIESDLMFAQDIDSIQIHHKDVLEATAGQDIGLKTKKPCASGDKVIKILFD